MSSGGYLVVASSLVASAEKVYSPGGLIFSDGKILFSGDAQRARLFAPADFRRVELPGCVILPGFTNAHTHLAIPEVGRDKGGDFVGWILEVIKWRLFVSEDEMRKNVSDALEECSRSGIALVGDISYGIHGQYDAVRLRVRSFVEVIGLSEQRWKETKDGAVGAISSMDPRDSFVRPGISPHGLYTTGRGCFDWVRDFSRDRDLPVQIHFCESFEEVAFIIEGTGPLMDRIYAPFGLEMDDFEPWRGDLAEAAIRFFPRGAMLVHGTFLTPHQVCLLGEMGFSFVLCVRSNRFLTGSKPPVTEIVDGGISFALGTDGKGSGGALDMYDEMRAVADAYHGRMKPADFYGRLFFAATEAGARMLGFDDVTGVLSEGKRADFQVLDVPPNGKKALTKVVELGEPARVVSLFVDGCPLFGGDSAGFAV